MTIRKYYFNTALAICILLLSSACGILPSQQRTLTDETFPAFSYEGHRGARGLYPENSIGAMKTAIDIPKVTTLEMDCHITKDKKVIVYHDHYLNPNFVQYTNGKPLAGKDDKGIIYAYHYADLAQFDIGSKFYESYPEQQNVPTAIALLSDLIEEAEAYAEEKRDTPMFYNIETKSKVGKDGEYHPDPQEFSDLILQIVIDKGIAPRTVIQSFDKRTIQYINRIYPQIKTSYLIGGNNKKSISELIDELGFTPFIISPHYSLITSSFVEEAHNAGMKVVPWTVNDKEGIEKLEALQVDGIISDYPNLF